jgi:hypothetical protein
MSMNKNILLLTLLICSTTIYTKFLRSPPKHSINCEAVPVYVEEAECEDAANPFLVQNESAGDKAFFADVEYFKKEIQPKLACDYQPEEEETEEDREEFARELARFEEDELLLGDGDMIGGSGAASLDRDNVHVRHAEIDGFVDGLNSAEEQDAIYGDDDQSLVLDARTHVIRGHEHVDRDDVAGVWSPESEAIMM